VFKKNIHIATIFGIPIEINPSWFIIFFLVSATLSREYFGPAISELSGQEAGFLHRWSLGMISAILLFCSVLLHELSHSVVGRANGIPIGKITLFLFGGVAQMKQEPSSAKAELKMAIAGPFCSLILGLFCMAGAYLTFRYINLFLILQYLSIINIALMTFNLVPGFPLDGGRVLRAILWLRTGNFQRASRIAIAWGRGIALMLMVGGLLLMIFNLRSLGGFWLIILGAFLYRAAMSSAMHSQLWKSLEGLKVRDIMQEAPECVEGWMSVEEFAEKYLTIGSARWFPVVENGEYRGAITLKNVRSVSHDKRSEIRIRNLLDPSSASLYCNATDDATAAAMRIMSSRIQILPVLNEGIVVGRLGYYDLTLLLRAGRK